MGLFGKKTGQRDGGPLLLSLLWQRDECSRMVGRFAEKELPHKNKVIIVSIDGDVDKPDIEYAGCDSSSEAAGILMKAAHKVADNGV
jgi:hypothetical protein